MNGGTRVVELGWVGLSGRSPPDCVDRRALLPHKKSTCAITLAVARGVGRGLPTTTRHPPNCPLEEETRNYNFLGNMAGVKAVKDSLLAPQGTEHYSHLQTQP